MNDTNEVARAGMLLIAFLIMCAVMLIPQIFYLLTLQKALNRCAPNNRTMTPGLVWLTLIPIFHLVWNFFVYLRIPASYQAYFAATGKSDDSDFGRGIGLAYAICAVCCFIPLINYLAGPAALILLIVFLVKAAGYKKQIAVEAAPTAVPPSPVA